MAFPAKDGDCDEGAERALRASREQLPLHGDPNTQSSQVDNIDNSDSKLLNFYLLVGITETVGILAVILVIIWMFHYRGGFAWDGSGKEFNYHPVFMVSGMVFLYGNGKH